MRNCPGECLLLSQPGQSELFIFSHPEHPTGYRVGTQLSSECHPTALHGNDPECAAPAPRVSSHSCWNMWEVCIQPSIPAPAVIWRRHSSSSSMACACLCLHISCQQPGKARCAQPTPAPVIPAHCLPNTVCSSGRHSAPCRVPLLLQAAHGPAADTKILEAQTLLPSLWG